MSNDAIAIKMDRRESEGGILIRDDDRKRSFHDKEMGSMEKHYEKNHE